MTPIWYSRSRSIERLKLHLEDFFLVLSSLYSFCLMYKKLIFTFLIGISIYHLVHTALIYGSGLVAYSVFSFMKDLLRACVVGIGIWLLRSEIKSFFVLWQKEIILFVALLSRSVVLSVLQGRGADSILI